MKHLIKKAEGGGVSAADAPLGRIKVIDAGAHTLALSQGKARIAQGDHSTRSLHTDNLAAQILQSLVIGKGDAGKGGCPGTIP